MAKQGTANGLDAGAVRELTELSLTSLAGAATAAKARPVIEAALELARQSSLAAGKRSVSISRINLVVGGRGVRNEQGSTVSVAYEQPTGSAANEGPAKDAEVPLPIAYGGTGYVCVLVSQGPSPAYVCIYW